MDRLRDQHIWDISGHNASDTEYNKIFPNHDNLKWCTDSLWLTSPKKGTVVEEFNSSWR